MPPFDRLRGYFSLPARPLGRLRTAQPRLDRVLKGLGEAKRSPLPPDRTSSPAYGRRSLLCEIPGGIVAFSLALWYK
jgi:hypothetical protein